MLSLLHNLDTHSYTHRTYVISTGDAFSELKAQEFESKLAEKEKGGKRFKKRRAKGEGASGLMRSE